jgi:hypothetical protein
VRQKKIDKVVYRVALAATLGSTLRHLAALLWAVGVLCLLSRLWHSFQPELFLLLLLAPLTGLLAARGRFIDRRVAAAWLDKMAGGSGKIVTAFEQGEAVEGPSTTPRMRLGSAMLWNLPAMAFVALALLVPISRPDDPPSPTEAAVERLEDQLETLENIAELNEEQLEELQENLEDLESSEDAPTEAAFEAIDSLEEQLQELAEELADSSERAQEAMQEAQNAESPSESQKAMAEALEQLAESGLAKELDKQMMEALGAEGSEALREAMESGDGDAIEQAMSELTPEQLGQLAEAVTEALQNKMEKLAASGLTEPGEGQGEKCTVADAQAGHCVPGQGEGEGEGEGEGDGDGDGDGSGGVSRGGGASDLTWGDEPPNHDELFNSELLPTSELPDLKNSELIGEQWVDPEAAAIAQGGGGADVDQSYGEAAWDRDLSPRHRDAVGTFFEPEESNE